MLTNSKTEKLILQIIPTGNSKINIKKFKAMIETLGVATNGLKNPSSPYARLVDCSPNINVNDLPGNLKRIEIAWNVLKNNDCQRKLEENTK